MFGKRSTQSIISQPENFEGVEVLMAACDNYEPAEVMINEAGYCLSAMHRSFLFESASRVAALNTIAEKGIAVISARDRYRLTELAKEVRSFK